MSIIDRNGVYYMRFRAGKGVQVKQSTGLAASPKNLAKAKKMEADAKHDAKEAAKRRAKEPPMAINDLPFDIAADRFLSWAETEYHTKRSTYLRLRGSLRSAIAYFGNLSLSAIRSLETDRNQQPTVEGYKLIRRLSSKVADVTLHHDLVALGQFFKWAVKRGMCAENPVADVPRPSGEAVRINHISKTDEARYFEAARSISEDLYDLTKLMLNQGCRPMELMNLPCVDVNLDRRTILVANGQGLSKRGKTPAARRTLPLTPESYEILKRRKQAHPTWIFPSTRNRCGHVLTLNTSHDNTIKRLGLAKEQRFLIYDFRHAFGTRMATEHNIPLPTLKDLMGHSSIQMVMKYVHANEQAKIEAMKAYGASRDAELRSGIRLVKAGDN